MWLNVRPVRALSLQAPLLQQPRRVRTSSRDTHYLWAEATENTRNNCWMRTSHVIVAATVAGVGGLFLMMHLGLGLNRDDPNQVCFTKVPVPLRADSLWNPQSSIRYSVRYNRMAVVSRSK